MTRVSFVLGTLAAATLAGGCVVGPSRSPNPLGHQSPNKDLATQEQYPLKSSAVKEEVDRQFEEQYPGTVNWLYVWGKDRWFDMLDMVSWDLNFGRGFGVNAHVTDFVQVGLNWWDGQSWGMRGRTWGVWETSEVDRGLGPFYWVEYERHPTWGTQSLFDHDYKYMGWDLAESGEPKAMHSEWSEIGARAHLFAVGAGAAVNLAEIFDFVTGLIPIGFIPNLIGYHEPTPDLMADDTWSQIKRELEAEKGLGE
jgi:hypothetical protein